MNVPVEYMLNVEHDKLLWGEKVSKENLKYKKISICMNHYEMFESGVL